MINKMLMIFGKYKISKFDLELGTHSRQVYMNDLAW